MSKATLILAIVLTAVPAHATLVPVISLASNNATVQPARPRPVTAGKLFVNVEGSNNAEFASFGVLDFTLASFGGAATNAVGFTLQLTQVNATFSATGPISVYLSTQAGVSIESTNTNLNYVLPNNGSASVDSDLGTLSLLGTGTYTASVPPNSGSGKQDFYPLTLSGGTLTSFLSALNTGGTVRLVITPDNATTAATWAGFPNPTFPGPTLAFFAVVPEPAAIVLAAIGIAALLLFKKPAYYPNAACLAIAFWQE